MGARDGRRPAGSTPRGVAWICFCLSVPAARAGAQALDCREVPRFEPASVPLTLTRVDPLPGSVPDGLLVRTAGEINTVSLRVEVRPFEELEGVQLGPLLPSSGFPVFLLDPGGGAPLPVADGQSLPLAILSPAPGVIEATLFVAGPGGGFAREVPLPLLVFVFTVREPVTLEISRWEAFAVDGAELTSVFALRQRCLKPGCEYTTSQDSFQASMGISLPEVEDRSILEGFPLLLQTGGQVQAGDFQLLFDPEVLEFTGIKVAEFFLREGCLAALVPAFGPGSILGGEDARVPPESLLRGPGEIAFGLSTVGLCAPKAPAPGSAQSIVELEFRVRGDVLRLEDVLTQIGVGPETRLFGTDGAPLSTFFDRTSACYRFPGLECPAEVVCRLTEDCRGVEVTWNNLRYERVEVQRDGFKLATLDGALQRFLDPAPRIGLHTYSVAGTVKGNACFPRSCAIEVPRPLGCPDSFSCQLEALGGERVVQLAWRLNDVYDSLRLTADGSPVAVEPRATTASVRVAPGAAVPLHFTLTAHHGEKSCPPATCSLIPLCVSDFVASAHSDGTTLLSWEGEGAVTIRRRDLFSGRGTILVQSLEGARSIADPEPPGRLGVHYQLAAAAPQTGEFCGLFLFNHGIPLEGKFIRGDLNVDRRIDIGDVIAELYFLFGGGFTPPCLAAADVNGDGRPNVADPVHELSYLFLQGPPPPFPFPGCGRVAPSPGFSCDSSPPCAAGGAFPRELSCELDPSSARVRLGWTAGSRLEGLSFRYTGHPPVEVSPLASSHEFALRPEDYGRELLLFLTAASDGVSRTLSCALETPAAGACPGGFACVLDPSRAEFQASWQPGGGLTSLALIKDTGSRIQLDPRSTSASLAAEPEDRGRVVELRLEAERPFLGPCSSSCQVEVPLQACPAGLTCALDLLRRLVEVHWTAGAGIERLEIKKGDAVPVELRPDASSALVPLAEADFGSQVDISLSAPGSSCEALACRVDVPPAPVTCPATLACSLDRRAGAIRISWLPAGGLDALHLVKDELQTFELPPDAEAFNARLSPGDFGRTVGFALVGFVAGRQVCRETCAVAVPKQPVCPRDLACAADVAAGVISATWTAGDGLDFLALLKDGVPLQVLPPDASAVQVPLAPADYGQAVVLTLSGSAGERLVCRLDCLVEVPPRVTCFANLQCFADVGNGLLLAAWEAAQELDALQLLKDGVLVQNLPPDATNAMVPLDDGDFGRQVLLTLQGIDGRQVVCQAECSVTVPQGTVCPRDLACAADVAAGVISATWTAGVGLDSLVLLKDGVPVQALPPDASAAQAPLAPADYGRAVVLTLVGSVGGRAGCRVDCRVEVPSRFACFANLQCFADVALGLIVSSWDAGRGLEALQLLKNGVLVHSLPPDATAAQVPLEEEDFGTQVLLTLEAVTVGNVFCQEQCAVDVPPRGTQFIRGDCNAEGTLGTDDAALMLSVARDEVVPPCLKACDANDDGSVTSDDAPYLLRFLTQGGEPPPPPFPTCGANDLTPDALDCQGFPACPLR